MAKQKRSLGSVRAKAGLPAKAGRRRPPNMISKMDRDGKRQWETTNSGNSRKSRNNFDIANRKDYDIYSNTGDRVSERNLNLFKLNNPKNKDRIQRIKGLLSKMANNQFKSDPFWFGQRWNEFKKGWISMEDIEKGRVA